MSTSSHSIPMVPVQLACGATLDVPLVLSDDAKFLELFNTFHLATGGARDLKDTWAEGIDEAAAEAAETALVAHAAARAWRMRPEQILDPSVGDHFDQSVL